MNTLQKIMLTMLALAGTSTSLSAYADCTFASGYSADTQEAINFGNLTIPSSTAIGTVVASKTSTLISGRDLFITGCTTFNQHDWRAPGLPPVSYGGQTLYQSGVAGYAIRIVTPGAGSTAGRFGSGAFDRILTGVSCVSSGTSWSYCGGSWGAVTFQLVKISNTTGTGSTSTGRIIRASIRGWQYIYSANLVSSTITNPACTVTNNNVAVPMGNVKRNIFNGVGYTGLPVQFFISLNCQAGSRINFKIDATADSSGAPGVMAINSSATGNAASGVGIKLTRGGTPVAFGTTTLAGVSANNGLYSIPIIAQYYQTQPIVTAGQANGTATFTMTYN